MPFSSKYVVLISLVMASMQVDAAPHTDLYEITSGTYIVKGGLFGPQRFDLPASFQTFIELTIDNELLKANMSFLSLLGTRSGPPFVDGEILGDLIVFNNPLLDSKTGATGKLDYHIQLLAGRIIVNGEQVFEPTWFDYPFIFIHHEVEATLVPEIPTLSEWGIVTMGLLVLVGARICFTRLYSNST